MGRSAQGLFLISYPTCPSQVQNTFEPPIRFAVLTAKNRGTILRIQRPQQQLLDLICKFDKGCQLWKSQQNDNLVMTASSCYQCPVPRRTHFSEFFPIENHNEHGRIEHKTNHSDCDKGIPESLCLDPRCDTMNR